VTGVQTCALPIYSVSDNLSFYIEESFLRKPDISKMFFSYRNKGTTFTAGYTLVNFSLSQIKGPANSSFITPDMVDELLDVKRNLIGLSVYNKYDSSGIWVGVYGNGELHLRTEENGKRFFQKNDSPLSVFVRAYRTLYMTDTKLFHVGAGGAHRHIHGFNTGGIRENSVSWWHSNNSDVYAHSIELIARKGVFNLEATIVSQRVGYWDRLGTDGCDNVPKEVRHGRAVDIEATVVLTGEQKRYDNGVLHAVDVRNSVSGGGFGAFEFGVKACEVDLSSKKWKKTDYVRAAALNWTPEKNIRMLFNYGRVTRETSNRKREGAAIYDMMLRVFF
jgi:hypothetical protein